MHLVVPEWAEGLRLDQFLWKVYPSIFPSRQKLISALKQASLQIGSRMWTPPRPSIRLQAGMSIQGVIPVPPSVPEGEDFLRKPLDPFPAPLDILYEDDSLIVLAKPAGMVVHPGAGNTDRTLVHALIARYPDLQEKGWGFRYGLVHRLDKETSGVMVIARTPHAQAFLSQQFADRQVQKVYLAICVGIPAWKNKVVQASIGRDPVHRTRYVIRADGRNAETHFSVKGTSPSWNLSLIQAKPVTGRTHQIRVHLQGLGYPILGDAQYGGWTRNIRQRYDSLFSQYPVRVLLHAWKLTLIHPVRQEKMTFEAPLPADFRELLEQVWRK